MRVPLVPSGIKRVSIALLLLICVLDFSIASSAVKQPVADARCGFSGKEVTQKYVYILTGKKVYFDGSRSFDKDRGGSIAGYYWDFDDGYTDIGAKTEHEFSSPGKYAVKLVVVDNENLPSAVPSEVSVYVTERISVKILKPRDNAGFVKGKEDIEFLGEAGGGTPCYGKPNYRYVWKSDKVGIVGNEKEFSIENANLPLGTHTITLEVDDCAGNNASATINITIVEPLKAEILETCRESTEEGNIVLGRVVFDSSWSRFLQYSGVSQGTSSCNNSMYTRNIAKWLNQNGKILVYASGGKTSEFDGLKSFLVSEGYSVDVIEKPEKITYGLLSGYGQVWFLDTMKDAFLDEDEINAMVKYRNNKGNILLSGEADEDGVISGMVNGIAENFYVSMNEKISVSSDAENCIAPSFKAHDISKDVVKISTSKDDLLLRATNPKIIEIANVDGKGYIFALDYETVTTATKSYICDCQIKFTGKASGGMPPYEVKWISLEDGVIDRFWINRSEGTYTLLTTPPLVPPLTNGTHAIRFEITDSLGMSASDTNYEVYVKWCCALGTDCTEYWPKNQGPLVDTGNENSHSCDIYEVCHPDLWQLAREAVECCKWGCSGRCHEKCEYAYSEGAKLGTTPEGLDLDGLKKCEGLYTIYGFGPEEEYMADYFWAEICCMGDAYCLNGCCLKDLGKCRCSYHEYTKNVEALKCPGSASSSPAGWSSDAAMNKNSCYFSDLSAHMSILGDQGIVTSASGLNTGTCCDYANSLATMLRIVGYNADEVYANTGPGHCYNLVKFPQDDKFHLIDTVGNCNRGFRRYTEPYVPRSVSQCITGYPYCSYFNCRNDKGTFPCPSAYGC